MNIDDIVRPPRTEKRKRRIDFETMYALSDPTNSGDENQLLERAYAAQRRGYVLKSQEDQDINK